MQRKLQSNKKQRKSAASWQKQGASERSARPSLSCHRPLHCLGSLRRGSWRGDDPLPARLLSRSVDYVSLSRPDGSNPGSPAVISGRLNNLMLFLLVAVLAGFAVQHYSGTATRPLCINGHPAPRQSGVTYGGLRPGHGFQRGHCIPLGLGGADEPGNVWLQPEGEARRKDAAEWQAIEAYCRGEITLEEARSRFVGHCHPGD
jgi:hypothetical protein